MIRFVRFPAPGVKVVLFALTLISAAACEEDEVVTPTRYLERPNAIDFFCVGPLADESGQPITALPAYACDEKIEGAKRRAVLGLVANSARSEVAMVSITDGVLVDLQNENPGFGFVPVGESPVGVKMTEDGCAGYVTNYGSCDLSVVNVNAVLHAAGFNVLESALHGTAVGRIGIRSASGRLLTRPHSLVLKPVYTDELPPVEACGPIRGHRAYISLPACGLVAEVDLDSGRVLQSLRFEAGTVAAGGIDPLCPSECVDFQGDGVGGGDVATWRPGPLLVTWDGLRLVIGSQTTPQITIVDIDPQTGQLLRPRTIALAEEERGIRRIRETVTWTNDWHFLYVVTRSGVVHVIDGDWEEECETNPDPTDPQFPTDPNDTAAWEALDSRKGCLRLSDPATPERAPGVTSPAIQLPGKRKVVDVAFVELDHVASDDSSITPLDPSNLGGTFAYMVTMDGLAYLVNVDEEYPEDMDPGTTETPLQHRRGDGIHAILSHQLRSSVNTLPAEDGRPRPEDDEAQDLFLDGELLAEPTGYDRVSVRSGDIEPDIDIIDPYRVRSEVWSLSYMGVLPSTTRVSGQIIRHDLSTVGVGRAEFRDSGLPFCQFGVRDGDVLVLPGCASTRECADGFYCYRSFVQSAGSTGICLANDTAAALEQLCEGLAVSRREYWVDRAEEDRLILSTREIGDATACVDDALARFCCDGAGVGDVVGVLEGERCLAGPLPDSADVVPTLDGGSRMAACFEGLVSYKIRVGDDQYLLSGSLSGTQVGGVPDVADDGHCIDDPSESSVLRARVARSTAPFSNAVLGFALELAEEGSAQEPVVGFVIQFQIVAGFSPTAVDVSARLPAAIELGPDGYLYIADQGDDSTLGGLQGQVLRLLPGDIALDTGFVVR